MNKSKPGIISISLIYSILFGTTGIVLLWTFLSYKDLNIDLSKVDSHKGVVTEKGTTSYHPGYHVTYLVEYIVLKGQTQKFGVDESGVLVNVNIGDLLTIYYKKSDKDLNLTIYQIEKGNSIIKSKEAFESSGKIIFIVGLIGSAVMVGVIIWSMTRIHFDN